MHTPNAGMAAPCADRECRTTGGPIRPGNVRPSRSRGLCDRCHDYHALRGTLDEFPLMHPEDRQHRRAALNPVWLVRQRREAEIARRVAAFESVGDQPAASLIEGEDNAAQRIVNAERTARAWLAAHPWQFADWSRLGTERAA